MKPARNDVRQAITLNPNDAAIQTLAGQISLDGKDYKAALVEIQTAVRLQPEMARAHYLLHTAYLGLGDKSNALEEANQIEGITEKNLDSDRLSPWMERLLYSVGSSDDAAVSQ